MGYDFGTKDRSSKNEKTPMGPGPKVEATFVGAEVDDKGHLFFSFKNDSGSLRHKEYAIDPTAADFKPEWADTAMERMNHIACALVDSAKVDAIPGNVPFATWAGQLAALLNTAKDTKVTLHVIVNKNNYSSFPLYINFISSEKAECGWVTNPQYHKYTFAAKPANGGGASDAGSTDARASTAEIEDVPEEDDVF
jgi:hypothetical protein